MKKLLMGLFLTFIGPLLFNFAHAEEFENFDAEIRGISWDYNSLEEELEFDVRVFNILDRANYRVPVEIESGNNEGFATKRNISEINTGQTKSAEFAYPVMTVDHLFVNTWINPPSGSANPTHKFDAAAINISSDEIWKKVKNAVKGVPLEYDVKVDESSNLYIEMGDISLESENKGIRIIHAGNSKTCDSFTLESENVKFKELPGDRFFDRTIDFGKYAEMPDFDIICNTINNDEILIPTVLENSKEDFKKNLVIHQGNANCENVVICIVFPNGDSGSNEFPFEQLLVVVAAAIGLVTVLIKFNWIPLSRRQKTIDG